MALGRRLLVMIVIAAASLFTSGALAASPGEEAGRYYAIGSKALDAKQYDSAIEAFEKAYKMDQNPALLWNLARANFFAGYLVEAKKRFDTFLGTEGIPEKKRAEAQWHLDMIAKQLREKADLAAEKERERLARLEQERKLKDQLELEKRRKAEPAGGNTAAIAVTVVGGALVVGGLPFHLWSFDASDEMGKYDAPVADLTEERRLALYDDAKGTKRTTEAVAGVLYGVGGAVLITGIVLFFVLDPDEGGGGEGESLRAAPWVAPGAGGLSLSGRF